MPDVANAVDDMDVGRSGLKGEMTVGRQGMNQNQTGAVRASEQSVGSEEDGDRKVTLPREAHGRIGQHLRRLYGQLLAEPLPEKIANLVDQLPKSEREE